MSDTNGTADLVFVNGPVYTVDGSRSWAAAVAVKSGTIVAVGTDDDVRAWMGAHTEIVDLAGRMLLPGFQDAHIHPPGSGLEMLRCNLSEIYSLEEYRRIIAEYSAANPDAPWILGGGWYMDVFPGGTPTKEVLDAIVPDRPAMLTNRDGHGAWVNSRALALGGITRDTPDPADGRIERTPEGEPSGTLHEGAMHLVGAVAPQDTDEDYAAGLQVAQTYLHSLGITAWQDAIVGIDDSYRTLDTYAQAAGRGDLTARVVGALWWDRHRGLDQIERLVDARTRASVGRFSPTSVKIMQDGIIENFTAATLTPYLDAHGQQTENLGLSFVDPELLKDAVTRQLPGAGPRRDHAGHAGSGRRAHRANAPMANRPAPSTRERCTSVDAVAPQDTDEDYAAGLRVAQTYLHSLAMTAWQDAIVGIDDSYRTLDTYAQAAGEGSSPRASSARSGGTGIAGSTRSNDWSTRERVPRWGGSRRPA